MIRDLEEILIDTGPFCRFAEGKNDQLEAFINYLGDRAWIMRDVERELAYRARKPEHAALSRPGWDPKFPRHEALLIEDRQTLQQIEDIVENQRRLRQKAIDAGATNLKPKDFLSDRGEVATVLMAKKKAWPTLLDDGWAAHTFAPNKGVTVFSTETLCVEMAYDGVLTEAHAFEVFTLVYGNSRAEFTKRLRAI